MNKKTLYAFILSFILLTTVIVLNRVTFNRMKEFTYWVNHTREVISTFEKISNDFKSAQIYTKTFPSDSLKNFYTLYKKESDEINPQLAQLKNLVKDNADQSRRVDSLIPAINKHLPLLLQKNIGEIIQMGQGWRLNELFAIHQTINEGIRTERNLLDNRSKELKTFTDLNNLLSIVFGILAIAIVIMTFLNIFFISKKRKWLEGFLESILNTSRSGVVHFKAIRENNQIVDFRIEFLNRAMRQVLGKNSKILIGKQLSELPSFETGTELLQRFIHIVESQQPAEFETLSGKENNQRWFLISAAKLDDGVTASFHDITQLKRIESDLKNKVSDLERSNTELEQYAYVASHDLQEPLRKIRSFGSYLQDTQAEKLDKKGQELLDRILSSAERMSMLINDILSFSNLKKQSQFVSVNLNEIVNSVQQDLDLLITQKNAVIEIENLPTIEAIPLQMTQLFYNLLNNSLKFTKDGQPPLIKISCMITEEKSELNKKPTRFYKITVSDNGIGFNMSHNEQIFGLFKRLNNRQAFAGSGIGLSLCRKVVENHNGKIFAEGKENEGATFHIYLPEKQV